MIKTYDKFIKSISPEIKQAIIESNKDLGFTDLNKPKLMNIFLIKNKNIIPIMEKLLSLQKQKFNKALNDFWIGEEHYSWEDFNKLKKDIEND